MMDVQGDTKSDSSTHKADSDKSNSARSQPQPYGQLWSERWPRRTLSSSSSITNQKSKTLSKVDRSQSYKLEKKDCMPSISRDRRKHSDPSIPTSIARASLDDAEYSSQDVTHRQLRSQGFRSVASSSLSSSTNLGFDVSQSDEDSDFETEVDPPDWRLSLSPEELEKLKPREKKRQDVINEFFHTERSHVRNLKVLDRLFCRPLKRSMTMSGELTERLFPNLDEVLSTHLSYSQKMKDRIKAGYPIGRIGDILTEMFEGANGDCLIRIGSEFTKNQKFSIEELKDKRHKDHKLESFLAEQERRPECRRLQLQSILPMEHQRLVKYPLLLEQLLKQCDFDSDENEYNTVKKCVERTREILESIDHQVAEAQNIQRLAEIQRNLDTSALEKMTDNSLAEYKNIDLTRYRLIYDGPMTLKLGDLRRLKTVDLHVLLLENCLMLLQKQDEKFILKFHTSSGSNAGVIGQSGSGKFCHSPIITFDNILIRTVATDKKALYLINTTEKEPQIYELTAASTAERAQWFRHITEASLSYREREGNLSRDCIKYFQRKSEAIDLGGKKLKFETSPSNLELDSFLSSTERLLRKDLEVTLALEEKHRLLSEILNIPHVTYDHIVDVESEMIPIKDAREVALAAFAQAKNLSDLVNTCLSLNDEDETVINGDSGCLDAEEKLTDTCFMIQGLDADKIVGISDNMNQYLATLLSIIQTGEDEKERLRKELQLSRDQVNGLLMQQASNKNEASFPDNDERSICSEEINDKFHKNESLVC